MKAIQTELDKLTVDQKIIFLHEMMDNLPTVILKDALCQKLKDTELGQEMVIQLFGSDPLDFECYDADEDRLKEAQEETEQLATLILVITAAWLSTESRATSECSTGNNT